MGQKEAFYSYLVPEMIWLKFHENQMLGSAKTKFPLFALTSWVKVLSPFEEEGIFLSFWLGSPIDSSSGRLNCILHGPFMDTPLDGI